MFCSQKKRKGKSLKVGALPSKNLPEKSHPSQAENVEPCRKIIRVIAEEEPCHTKKPAYKNLRHVSKRVKKLKLKDWTIENGSEQIVLKKQEQNSAFPEIE